MFRSPMTGVRIVNPQLLGRVLMVATFVGCTPTHSHLEPYRSHPDSAAALASRAAGECERLRGVGHLPPHPFTTDGCSMSPDGDWADCCVAHDIAYWCGGPAAARKKADRELARCVAGKGHSKCFGDFMRACVRVGGQPLSPFPWRWGYGWDGVRGYDDPGGR